MKYFLDTEFIEDARTIDLLSIGIVAEDGRELYAQPIIEPERYRRADDFVARHVLPKLEHFDMGQMKRDCKPLVGTACDKPPCPWVGPPQHEPRNLILEFCNIAKWGKPEFWGYYAAYDWVAFSRLFGRLVDRPTDWPMYCKDLKQLAASMTPEPRLPAQQPAKEHHALEDARWIKRAYQQIRGETRHPDRYHWEMSDDSIDR